MAANLLQPALQHLKELHLAPQAPPFACAAQNAPRGNEYSAAGAAHRKFPCSDASKEVVLRVRRSGAPPRGHFPISKEVAVGFLGKQRRNKVLSALGSCIQKVGRVVENSPKTRLPPVEGSSFGDLSFLLSND